MSSYKLIIYFILIALNELIYTIPINKQQRVLLVSFDGFRYDYIDKYNLNHFSRFLNFDGASRAPYIKPQYTTQTFPNHWSLVTGSYVETHGIVANEFYDPVLKDYFKREKLDYSDLKWWNACEPIWFTSARNELKTAAYFWPGSDTLFSNSSLYKRVPYNKYLTFENKTDQVIDWFLNENYTFVLMYHYQPDQISHKYGINTQQFNETIQELDKSFGYLINKLKESNLYESDDFNLIVVSDHGMVNVENHIILDDYINETDVKIWSESGNLFLMEPLIHKNILLNKLSQIENAKAVEKENLDDKFKYKNNHRIAPVVLMAEEGHAIIFMRNRTLRNGKSAPVDYEKRKEAFIRDSEKATHGFNNDYENMRGLFLARGALFKRNFTSEPFENIDLYPFLCKALSISCDKRNGTLGVINSFFNSAKRINLNLNCFIFILISLFY